MPSVNLIWYLLIVVVFASPAISYANEKAPSSKLQLVVTDITKPENKLFPGAKAYSGKLTNTTTQPIRLEAIQMPGGYLGNGTFYPCEVQFWNGKTKRWRSFGTTSKRSEHSAGLFFHAEMKPNESLEVCRTLLVKERIKGGKCARFALSFQWNHKPEILSKPFVIPAPDKPEKHIHCPQ
jgi:hypothetical protein